MYAMAGYTRKGWTETSDLIELIKQAAVDAVNAAHPTTLIFGKVTAIRPLTVTVNQWLALTEDFLVLGDDTRKKLMCDKISAGDTLILLQQQGGQRFAVLDTLHGADWQPETETVSWNSITDKPKTYPPEKHEHSWPEIKDKPQSYPPAPHTHGMEDLTGITDYIIAQGTSGIWTYRKWASGISECWGIYTASGSFTNSANQWRGLYFVAITSGVAFPEDLFTEKPTLQVLLDVGNFPGFIYHDSGAAVTHTGAIAVASPGAFTINDPKLHLYAAGKWK